MTSRRHCQRAYHESKRRRDDATLKKGSDKDYPSPSFPVCNHTILYCAHRAMHIPIVRALQARRTVVYLPLILHRPFYFAAGFARLNGFPAVMLLLPFGQPELDLGQATLGKIDPERDEREPLLLRLAEELVDLLAMEEQFPGTERLVIHDVAMAVGTNVAMMEKDLALLYAGIAIL